jgi:hypothetical protein
MSRLVPCAEEEMERNVSHQDDNVSSASHYRRSASTENKRTVKLEVEEKWKQIAWRQPSQITAQFFDVCR